MASCQHLPFACESAALGLLCVCLLAMTLASLAEARPKSAAADLRVVDPDDRTLAEGTQLDRAGEDRDEQEGRLLRPGHRRIRRRGRGSRLDRARSARQRRRDRRRRQSRSGSPTPSTSGSGICRIGPAVSPATGYWYLKVNHAASFSGADQTKIRRGDDVLWYLIEDFNDPIPDELELSAPATAEPGQPFEVEVTSWADNGDESPAAGATVTGADAPTDARGEDDRDPHRSDRRSAGIPRRLDPLQCRRGLHGQRARLPGRLRDDGRRNEARRPDHRPAGAPRRSSPAPARTRSMRGGGRPPTGSTAGPAGTA